MKPIPDNKEIVAPQIRDVLRRLGHCELDTLCAECVDLTWNQVFMEIDRMSRMGEVCLRRRSPGTYVVSLPLKLMDAHRNELRSPEPEKEHLPGVLSQRHRAGEKVGAPRCDTISLNQLHGGINHETKFGKHSQKDSWEQLDRLD